MVGGGKGGMRWTEDVWKETSEGRLGGEFGGECQVCWTSWPFFSGIDIDPAVPLSD